MDDSSDSGSSYSRTARATRLNEEMTAACQKKSPPPTTEDEDADIDMQLTNDVIPDKEPLTPRVNKGKGRAFEDHEENDEDMQDIETGREGDHTENSDDEIVASPLQRCKGGRMPDAGLKACSNFGNKTHADADELATRYNCKRQTVMLKAGLHVASARGNHIYGSEAVEGLLSDAKVPLDKLIDLMITAMKSRLAGLDFDGSTFLSQLWPELFNGSNASKDTRTTTVTGSTCGKPNVDDVGGTGDTSTSERVTGSLPNKKDNNICKPKIATTKLKKWEVITISDTKSVKLGPKQKKKKTANQGPKDNNRGMVSTFWHDTQNEINGVVKARASFKTFATDLEVVKKTLTAFPLHIPFPGYLDGDCCYTDIATLRSGLVSAMAKRMNTTNPTRPFLRPWTDKEKLYRKGTAKYEAIPIIEMGEGSVGPSMTIATTLDAKMNCEAYALQHGKAVPIESDHESNHEGNHSSIVDHNEQPIAPLPSQPPPSRQMGTHSNTKKHRHVDSGSDNEATPKKVLQWKEAHAKDDGEDSVLLD
ncbi:hypothetical protein DXG01_008231 [Tephrocybe rancida]|nr:hypothetical protein DXG01_008231 [Tephrocybe rancida]